MSSIEELNSRLDINVPYQENEKQQLFHTSIADEVLYGGAKGGGKSCALIMDSFKYAMKFPGATIYLFRKTYDDLEANLITEWKAKVPEQTYSYNEGKHRARMVNGSTVYFRYIGSMKDALKYDGRSIDYIGVDELTHYEEEWIQVLYSCVRSPKGFPACFRATTNPGNIGHRWVKRRYITATVYGKKMYVDKDTKNMVQFIPATVYDNKVLMENDPRYVKRLENLSHEKKLAYLYGDWDVYEGQAFPEFSRSIHVCEPFEIPKHWRRWTSLDNGYSDPFYWGSLAVDEEGTVYVYREYTRNREDTPVYYTDQGKQYMERIRHTTIQGSSEVTIEERIDFIVAGVDAWNTHHRDQSGKSLLDYYKEGGVDKIPFIKAITDRKLRKSTFHEYLKPVYDPYTDKWRAKLQIMANCKVLIDCLENLIEDEEDPEKVADCDFDHPYDSVGYGIISHHMKVAKPTENQYESEIMRAKTRAFKKSMRIKRLK